NANSGLDVDAVSSAQEAYLQRTEMALEKDAIRDKVLANVSQKFANFDTARAEVQARLADTANALEQRMVATEEDAKVQVQSHQASVDTLDALFSETFGEVFPAL